ncbi:MAG: Rpn family recombination-promoting nuclease/putative transposase [Bacteroidia bacterium]|nr:Rpn family recombination-promoting nuclease/putative transposase [Bacteroidia bacterium]
MIPPQNPHDGLFKATFTNQTIVKDYLRNFLPAELTRNFDFESLRLEPGSYITPELEPFYSDIVYECAVGKKKIMISLLFEHKSTPPRYPHIQLLRYMVEAWEQRIKNKQPLKLIVPIIVYHGKKKWTLRPFHRYFAAVGKEFLPFIPQFDYHLTDLRQWSDEALIDLQAGLLINTFLLFKHHGEDEYLKKSIRTLFISVENYAKDETQRNLILSFFVYLWTTSDLKDKQFIKLIEQLPQDLTKETMTTYEQILHRGELKGELKGKVEGKIEGKIEKENLVISNAFANGFSIETIAMLTELSQEEVQARIISLGLQNPPQ